MTDIFRYFSHIMLEKGGIKMDNWIFLMLANILAGVALIKVPLEGTFLEGIIPVTTIIGILAVLIFSFYLLFKGVRFLFGKY